MLLLTRTRLWIVLVSVALGAIAVQMGWDAWRDASRFPASYWIWAPDAHRSKSRGPVEPPEPVAFLVAKDFLLTDDDLEERKGHLDIVADESYRVWINGFGPGTGIYRPGGVVDRWKLGRWLRRGTNRLVLELRSQRGAGGLLGELRVGDRVWGTDSSWWIVDRWDVALFGGWAELDHQNAREPVVWGRSSRGRWRPGAEVTEMEIPVAPSLAGPPRRPVRARHPSAREDEWVDLNGPAEVFWDPPRLGPEVVWDFGRTVEGVVGLELGKPADLPSLVFFGEEPPNPARDLPVVFTAVPGSARWESIVPRRFRYMLVVGVELAAPPEVYFVEAASTADRVEETIGNGVFGLYPPRERTRAEELVWNRVRGGAE